MTVRPGVTGLLGPNGAGKTTIIALMAGFLAPSAGTVTLDGEPVWRHTDAYRTIGLVPERELSFGYLTGRQFVLANAELHGLDDPGAATERALDIVEMGEPGRRAGSAPTPRACGSGSSSRRRWSTTPSVLLLDEPFNGVDPRQRLHLMALLRRMGGEGRTVLFSSHILEEVEQVARQIEVVVSGRHAASGDFGQIRRLMTDRPVQYVVVADDDRRLAASLIAEPSVVAVSLRARRRGRRLGLRLRRVRGAAAAGGARARHPDLRADAHRRVARERLRLPGGWLSDEPHPAAPVDPGPLRTPTRRRARCSSPAPCSRSPSFVRLLTDDEVGLEAVVGLGFTLALPLVALLAATAVLGPEIDDGSVVYLLAKPVNRHVIAVQQVRRGVGQPRCCSARCRWPSRPWCSTPSQPGRAGALAVGAAVSGTVYTALFLGLAALTRHAVVVGLLFVLVWEGVLGVGLRRRALAVGRGVGPGGRRRDQPAGRRRRDDRCRRTRSWPRPLVTARRRSGSPATGCGRSPCAGTSSGRLNLAGGPRVVHR